MQRNDFGHVYELACKAFAMGETLVFQGAERTVGIKPVFMSISPTINVTEIDAGLRSHGNRTINKQQYREDEFEGFEIPRELKSLLSK